MKFLKYLNEMAYDFEGAKKYKDPLIKDLYNWTRNERQLTWSENEIKKAQRRFGNVPVGIVYRGAKINTEEQLKEYQAIKDGKKKTISLHLASSTPHETEANSFAMYVKSYDEMTMMYMLSAAIKRGSAGQFGSVLLTLKPKPEQVIAKLYSDGAETKYNKDWESPDVGLESEAILSGDIEVSDIKIYEPLTKENFVDVLYRAVNSIKDLDNDFAIRWIWEHKLSKTQEFQELKNKLCEKLLKTEDDIATFIKSSNSDSSEKLMTLGDVKDYPKVQKFIKKYVTLSDNEFVVVYKNQKLLISSYILRQLNLKVKPEMLSDLFDKLPNPKFKVGGFGAYIDPLLGSGYEDVLGKIYRLIKIKPELKNKVKNHKWIKALLLEINTFVKKYILEVNLSNMEALEKTLPKYNNELGYFYRSALSAIKEGLYFVPKTDSDKITRKILQHFHQKFVTHGPMTPERRRAVEIYSKVIKNVFELIHESDLLKKINLLLT